MLLLFNKLVVNTRVHIVSCATRSRSNHQYWTRNGYSNASRARYLSKTGRGQNILLMGCPGAGKSSLVIPLAERLNMNRLDIDDDLLEPHWGMTVAQKLAEVGDKKFLELEAEVFQQCRPSGTIISLTGSQPMHDGAMAHARKLGLLIYVDVHGADILSRLSAMKVNRIVGFAEDADMEHILSYRQQFYERNYDIRVVCEPGESIPSITEKVYNSYIYALQEPGYSSTRDKRPATSYTFMNVAVQGLAPDRGLFVSNKDDPHMTLGQWERLVDLPYKDCALRILEQWIPLSEISRKELRQLVNRAYAKEEFAHRDIAPVVSLENNQYLSELFHGPSGSFKDMALQLTARIFHNAVKKEGKGLRSLMLVATSGDTGGAVMDAYSRHSGNTGVLVLFPEDGISAIQKAQLTSYSDPSCMALGVKGDFDFCQTAIKRLFTDKKVELHLADKYGYRLCSANSINFSRLLPQVVYHAWSYLLMVRDGHIPMGQQVDICVPTGNFGNILGAYYAKKMGIPIRKLIAASNNNNVVHDFFTTGVYDISNRSLLQTASPAIDILRSSNLERYLYEAGNKTVATTELFESLEQDGRFKVDILGELFETMKQDIWTGWCTNEESLQTVKDVFKRTGYLMDPHTAVAKNVADKLSLGKDVPVIIASTAHYSKFADSILDAFGLGSRGNSQQLMDKVLTLSDVPQKHQPLAECVQLPCVHKMVVEANHNEILEKLEEHLSFLSKKA